MPIANPLVDRVVEQSQTRVEGANFDVRKHLLEYDDVLNTQRAKIYSQRDLVFIKDDLTEDILEMLTTETEQRVEITNWDGNEDDQDSAWRLLSWLSQTQPTLTFQHQLVPSYTMQLLIDSIRDQSPELKAVDLEPILIDLGRNALISEKEYILGAVDRILMDRQFRYQDQLDMRMDTLDTFLEGLSLGSDEPLNPQVVFNEMRDLVRTRFELNPAQIKELVEGPGEDLDLLLRTQVETQLKELEFKRLIGGVERLLGSPLETDGLDLNEMDWDEITEWIVSGVETQFSERQKDYFDDADDARVVKSIQEGFKEIQSERLSDSELVRILGLMAEGRQAAFDKKSHKRIWLRTQRLRYTFHAAQILLQKDPETIGAEILDHLGNARQQVAKAWGISEINRLKEIPLSQLEPGLRNRIKDLIGPERYHKAADQRIDALSQDLQEVLQDFLGRSVVSNIYRDLFLRVISELWVEYLTEMEALRVSIGLEAYAQRDPLVQYKNRGFEMFQRLMEDMRVGVVNRMFTFQPRNLDRIQAGVVEKTPLSKAA
jgi:preprotein translocase subunit SecA